MAKLPKSIIKKYGISKKAWSVFRGKKSKKARGPTMAKRRGFGGRRRGGMDPLLGTALAAAVYGGTRERISNYISPFTSKVPALGNYSDEVVLGVAGYLLAKGKVPYLKGDMARNAGKAVLIIESARVGSGIANGVGFK